jgi:hypothetical protein
MGNSTSTNEKIEKVCNISPDEFNNYLNLLYLFNKYRIDIADILINKNINKHYFPHNTVIEYLKNNPIKHGALIELLNKMKLQFENLKPEEKIELLQTVFFAVDNSYKQILDDFNDFCEN